MPVSPVRRFALLNCLVASAILATPPCVWASETPATSLRRFDYEVPLDPHSPWPKFRRNPHQNGRSPLLPQDSGRAPWVFRTGKGVFSSAVVDADGTIYIGSGDRNFYAIGHDGNLKWKYPTGEIIDSSALLDDQGRVVFGSGDGHVYALERSTGEVLWKFAADAPALNSAFINWFEGNVGIGVDGTLYVPNDNFCTYALRRETGARVWCAPARDQTWSLPAVDPVNGRLFIGNNFAFLHNTFALDARSGEKIWQATADGSVAASPLLTDAGGDAAVVVGAFDGYVRAYDPASGRERWRFGARDHLYASPAEMADGTIVQPSADGSIYGINPHDGSLRWAIDTLEPLRSSPAIDGAGNIYVGSGEGRLFVLNPDGTLRWSIRLIDDDRDDLNASPALGTDAIIVAGESGGVFSVPYDYCLRPGLGDPRCTIGGGESLPASGVFLLYTTPFGRTRAQPPADIDGNQALAFSLFVRERGDTQLAVIDSESVRVEIEPPTAVAVDVSGDRRFITIVPKGSYAGPAGGAITMRVQGNYLGGLDRSGLRFSGGHVGGRFDQSFRFGVRPRAGGELPLPVPQARGDRAGTWELYRLAAPLPTASTSYNQIGFDSIHYLIGLVEGDGKHAVGWAVGGLLAGADNRSAVDPTSRVRFPLEVDYDAGLLTMTNEAGFTIEFNGFPLPFELFRIATEVNARGEALYSPALNSKTTCGRIDFYGEFLQALGYCNPTTDLLNVFGGAELRPHDGGIATAPNGVGRVSFEASYDHVSARLADSELQAGEHNVGILLIDPNTHRPLALDYMAETTHETGTGGTLAGATLKFAPGALRGDVRVYLMVDTYPAAVETVHVPESVPLLAQLADGAGRAWHGVSKFFAGLARRTALKVLRALG